MKNNIKNNIENNKNYLKNNLKLKIFFINFLLIFWVWYFILSWTNLNSSEKIIFNTKEVQEKISKLLINPENILENNSEKIPENNSEKISENILEIKKLISYKIDKVIDWDTIKIFDKNWEKKSIRMVGLDTPESYKTRFWYKECFWDEASDYLKKIIWDSEFVEVELDKTQWNNGIDKYWRLLWYVFLNWENLNLKMIKDGYWWEYTYKKNKYKYQEDFKNAEIFADENDLWLWKKNTCDWKRLEVK